MKERERSLFVLSPLLPPDIPASSALFFPSTCSFSEESSRGQRKKRREKKGREKKGREKRREEEERNGSCHHSAHDLTDFAITIDE